MSECWCRLWIVVKTICAIKFYEIWPLDLEVYVRKHLFYNIYIHTRCLSSPSVDITFDKLEAMKSVTSAYQQIAVLNISGRKLKKILTLIMVYTTSHQLLPTQLCEQKCRFTHYVCLPV
jgi:hypothetical protein